MFCVLFLTLSTVCGAFTEYKIVPPEPQQVALMARYIIHNTGWVSIATISTQDKIKGYPFVSLKSFSDGTKQNSTGIPYLYLTEMDVSGKDIESNNTVTIMATLAETNYCDSENLDPQDPRCAKVLMSGKLLKISRKGRPNREMVRNIIDNLLLHGSFKPKVKKTKPKVDEELEITVLAYFRAFPNASLRDAKVAVDSLLSRSDIKCDTSLKSARREDYKNVKIYRIKESSSEYAFGKRALFEKHPSMKNWPAGHQFYVAKIALEQIEVLDFFGGLKYVLVDDYFNANITGLINLDVLFNNVSVVEVDNF